MNTNTLSKNIVMGAITSSLLLGAFALTPHFASAAERTGLRGSSSLSATTLTCMQTAVDTREDAVATAFSTFNTKISAGLETRKASLHSAWGLSDGSARTTAIKSAWTKWRSDKTTAYANLKKDRKAAWDTFKNTAKTTCKETLPKEETMGTDSSGTTAL